MIKRIITKIRKINNIKLLLILILAPLSFFIQVYLFPDAGKVTNNKASQYSFQVNYWTEDIYSKFNIIKEKGNLRNIALIEGNLEIDQEFRENLILLNQQLSDLNRSLNHNGDLSSYIMEDSLTLMNKALPEMDKKEQREIRNLYQSFNTLTIEYISRKSKLESIIEEFTKAFSYSSIPKTTDEKVDRLLIQTEILKKLYSDESYFLNLNKDSFKLVRDLAQSSRDLLTKYEALVVKYNQKVKIEEAIKNSIMLFIAIIGFLLALSRESEVHTNEII
ncbi:hypothetical protein R50073_17960 [Maricurvus nonylphenolicus]|uniref:hypothetical protein n=1 Tax=Maricurvus nonylphenolicus TaxID=1008307 RepID=UPI0036F3F406